MFERGKKKRLSVYVLGIALVILVLVPPASTGVTPTKTTIQGIPIPPQPLTVLNYCTNASMSRNDGIATLSLGGTSYKYIEYNPYDPGIQDLNFSIAVSANTRQLYYHRAFPYPDFYFSGSDLYWTSETYYKGYEVGTGYDTGPANITGDDDGRWFDLPFGFQYYGVVYSTVWVCSNGFLSFESESTSPTPKSIPNSSTPNALIAGFWRDLNPSRSLDPGKAIRFYRGTEQVGGHQVFVVMWDRVLDDNTNTEQTFQIVLHENTRSIAFDDEIYFQYGSVTIDDPSTVIGVEDQTGRKGASYSVDQLQASHYSVSMIPGENLEGRSFQARFDHIWVSLAKTPNDSSASISLAETAAYNIQFDPDDVWNPAEVIKFGVDALLLCVGGVPAWTAALQQYATDQIIQILDNTFNTNGGFQFCYEKYQEAQGYYQEAKDIVESDNLCDYLKGKVIGDLKSTLYSAVEDFLWGSINDFFGPKLEGFSGFDDLYSAEAKFDGIVTPKDTCIGSTDTFLACLMDWSFMDNPAYNLGDTLVVTAGKRLDITVTLRYWLYGDSSPHYINATIPLSLADQIPPVMGHPDDVVYASGTTGHTIAWPVSDASPATYQIEQMYIQPNPLIPDEWEPVQSGAWTSGTISVNIDGLSNGEYKYRCTAHDVSGNSAQDDVKVTVISDTTPPTIDQPSDVTYEIGTSGHSVTWHPWDDNPVSYEIRRGAMTLATGAWSGGDLVISVDGLTYGTYVYTCRVTDVGQNSISDEVLVTVKDMTPPTISHPDDVSYIGGTTGHVITWAVSDSHPATYTICRMFLHHNRLIPDEWEDVRSGSWTSGTISVNVDGISRGEYIYCLVIYDISSNWAQDDVKVTVTPDTTPPTIDSPADITYGYGTTTLYLTWHPRDSYPSTYQIKRDSTVVTSGTWNGGDLTVNVGGLQSGSTYVSYTFLCTVTDVGGNYVSDSVTVTVRFETTNPSINSPADITYYNGETPMYVTWTASDNYRSGRYEIRRGSTLVQSGTWSNGVGITVNAGGLSTGTYYYTCTVWDACGNSASDQVKVTVKSTGPWQVTPAMEPSNTGSQALLFLGFALAGLAILASSELCRLRQLRGKQGR